MKEEIDRFERCNSKKPIPPERLKCKCAQDIKAVVYKLDPHNTTGAIINKKIGGKHNLKGGGGCELERIAKIHMLYKRTTQ